MNSALHRSNAPVFPDLYLPQLQGVILPPLYRVRLTHHGSADPAIADPTAADPGTIETRVHAELDRSRRLSVLRPASRVAIAVGSRGVAALPSLVRAIVGWVRSRGHDPVIIPAMGSHGGAEAQTQAALLHSLGVRPEQVGAPIVSSMATTELGRTAEGVPCRFSTDALAADAIIVLNRVKSHTSFDRPIESGLTKLVAVGLGKAEGARFVHRSGPRGLQTILPKLALIALARAPIAFGIAVVENAEKQLVHLEGVEPEEFAATDERLLHLAKRELARLPFSQLDVLVVQEIGKDISGMGMDYAVTGRTDIRGIANPTHIFIHKIVVLGLTAASHGNAQGIGVADFITQRVVGQIDLVDLYTNALTAAVIEKARIPPVLPTDEQAIKAAVATSWQLHEADVRLCVIRSTLHLQEILVSAPLLDELRTFVPGTHGVQMVEIDDELRPMAFGTGGDLLTRV